MPFRRRRATRTSTIVGGEKVFIDALRLKQRRGTLVVRCPFHPDASTPSLSIDLDQGLFFCHGSCRPPKGGDAARFLSKWLTLQGTPTTYREARSRLVRTHTILSYAEQQRQAQEDAINLFAQATGWAAAEHVRILTRAGRAAGLAFQGAEDVSDDQWDLLEALYKGASDAEGLADLCALSGAPLHDDPQVRTCYETAVADGEWSRSIERYANCRLDDLAARTRLLRQFEEEASCPPTIVSSGDRPTTSIPPTTPPSIMEIRPLRKTISLLHPHRPPEDQIARVSRVDRTS